jgi:hypothetical protein
MMADFHDTAQRAGKALVAATPVEAEAWSTGGGAVPCGSATPEAATGGGPVPCGSAIPQAATGGGGVPSGSCAPLATPPPELAVGGCDHHPRDPLMYPTHHTRAAHRTAATAATAKRKEHQGPP